MNKKNIFSLTMVLALSLVVFNILPFVANADNPVPTITSISPSSIVVGSSGTTLTVNGTNFVPGATVNINGSARSTAYNSSNQLTASIASSDLTATGTPSITVTNPGPGGGISNTMALTIASVGSNPVPTISSIFPSSKMAGNSAFTLNVYGTNFMNGSMTNFNGVARTTTYISPTQLTAIIPASDIANVGTYSVTVTNSTPGGGTSNAMSFTVTPSLPNTGFGPGDQNSGLNRGILAGIIASLSLISFVVLTYARRISSSQNR